MKTNRRSFLRDIFSCQKASTVVPYQSTPNNIGNGTTRMSVTERQENEAKIDGNDARRIRRESVVSLGTENLLADVNLNNASNVYRMQVDVLWDKESPLLMNALQKSLLNNNNKNCLRILDVGCGTGELLARLVGEDGLFEKAIPAEMKLILIGVELDRSVYEFCQKRCRKLKHRENTEISIINGNATKLPFDSNSFDLILNRHMLHCLPKHDIQLVINETWRILKMNSIVHFLVEDIEMIYTSVNNDQTLFEQYQLWSDGIYQTGAALGMDLRFGRKLPSALIKSDFVLKSVDYVSVDAFRCHRPSLYNIFHLWYEMYVDAYKRNRLEFKYKKAFENFLHVVQDKNEYVCWNVPIIQAMKPTATTVQ